jgi:hypothetical protein
MFSKVVKTFRRRSASFMSFDNATLTNHGRAYNVLFRQSALILHYSSNFLKMLSRTLGKSSPRWRPTRTTLSKLPVLPCRAVSTNNGFLKISEEIREAIHSKKPIVALETTIYTHGSLPQRFTGSS